MTSTSGKKKATTLFHLCYILTTRKVRAYMQSFCICTREEMGATPAQAKNIPSFWEGGTPMQRWGEGGGWGATSKIAGRARTEITVQHTRVEWNTDVQNE